MAGTRPPCVAGMFYSDNERKLGQEIDRYLKNSEKTDMRPAALIAPHAGYMYSGPVAGSAFAPLLSLADKIDRILLLGPSHRVAFRGLAVPRWEAFATPLGSIPVDLEAVEEIAELPQVQYSDEAHRSEHSLEVELPFLQYMLPEFKLIPIVTGQAPKEDVSETITKAIKDDCIMIIVSSDLSHYHDYRTAQKMDERTSRSIEELEPDNILHEHACGQTAINGLLHYARKNNLKAKTIDLRNSGDTAGSKDRVVGYGAFIFGSQ